MNKVSTSMYLFKLLVCILILTLASAEDTQLRSASRSLPVTTLRPAVERIFSRNKRFVLLPKGGSMKFTVIVSKRLLATVPRGFSFAIEGAFYYPGPSSRIDLLPQRLRKPTTTTAKPTGTTEPLYVYIPGSLVHYKAQPAAKPAKVQRIGTDAVQWIEPQNNGNYTATNKWSNKWQKYGTPEYSQKYAWNPQKTAQYEWKPPVKAKWTKWLTTSTTSAPKWGHNHWQQPHHSQSYYNQPHYGQPSYKYAHQRWGRDLPSIEDAAEKADAEALPYQPMYFDDLELFDDWKHYHSHRDRRQLFHQFEGLSKVLGIDMKSCILRAICESKRFLMPPGYSMIQDILRLIFTFPTISGLTDDYSRMMQTDSEACESQVRSQCPFSMLNFFTRPDKG